MEIDPGALYIIKKLQDAGYMAVCVGGCVRDWLMGAKIKDWDIATSAVPDVIEKLFDRTVGVGKAFGVMVVVHEGQEYEVATFRKDLGYADGRRPDSVDFCDAREDALRRDFTINALMYDPVSGKLEDYIGGREDLEKGIIRTVGRARDRFLEDHLRLLRAVRFAARTGFTIEPETFSALQEMAALARLVSAERIGQEFFKMFTGANCDLAFELLEQSRLLLHLVPELAVMRGMPQPEEFHPEGDVFEHTRIMLKMFSEDDIPPELDRSILAFAVLLHDVGKPLTLELSGRIRFNSHDAAGSELAGQILKRLKMPNRFSAGVCDLIGRHMHMGNLAKMRTAKLRRFLHEPLFPLHLKLHYYDCNSSHRMLDNYYYGQKAYEEEMAREPELEPLLGGKELIDLGYKPGPQFSRILEALLDAQLEGKVSNVPDARIWVKNHYRL